MVTDGFVLCVVSCVQPSGGCMAVVVIAVAVAVAAA